LSANLNNNTREKRRDQMIRIALVLTIACCSVGYALNNFNQDSSLTSGEQLKEYKEAEVVVMPQQKVTIRP